MQSPKFEDVLQKIVESDSRYHHDAYLFMREALEYTQRQIGQSKRERVRDVTGAELLDGIRRYAMEQFGPMAITVFSEWGIHCCEDFGEMVFLMVGHNVLSKTERDSRDDFKAGYSFHDAFQKPFLPSTTRKPAGPKSVRV